VVEYLLLPAAGLVLLGVLAVQFLVHGVTYGPRARRAMLLLGVPVAAAGFLVGVLSHLRPLWGRVAVGGVVAVVCYLGLATGAVLRWRLRKLAALGGDVTALRQRLAARRREVEALFWEMAAHPERPSVAAMPAESAVQVPDGTAVLHAWRSADPAKMSVRAVLMDRWRAEFARCSRAELLRRARVLEAASGDVPEDERDALEARLATLWLVYAALPEAPAAEPAPSPRSRWDDARRDVARLQAEMADVLRQHGILRRRRLPLD